MGCLMTTETGRLNTTKKGTRGVRHVYIFHTKNPRNRTHLWIAFDGVNTVTRRSYKKLLQAWIDEHGMIKKGSKFPGIMRSSEAALMMADIKMDLEKEQKGELS